MLKIGKSDKNHPTFIRLFKSAALVGMAIRAPDGANKQFTETDRHNTSFDRSIILCLRK